MSCFLQHSQDTSVNIVRFNEIDNVTYYEILIKCGNIFWTVHRRYKEFEKLSEVLVAEYALDKTLLPGKKVIGNKSTSFVKKRQQQLEKFIQDVFTFLKITMPRELVEFLDFHKYDIIFNLHNMAELFYNYGENYLARSKMYTFSVLEVYCISERLKLPNPPTEIADSKYDFSHVLDFINLLDDISILPVKNTLPGIGYDEYSEHFDLQVRTSLSKTIGTSCLIPEDFKFELSAFKNIKVLKIFGISSENITDATNLRKTIEKLYIQKTKVTDVKQILLCDSPVYYSTDVPSCQWTRVRYANFSDNNIKFIDKSIDLLPEVNELYFDRNRIEKLENLRALTQLSVLSLESNIIGECDDLHLQLGNLVTLNLSYNHIKHLKGFQKLYSLINLDLSGNKIDAIDEADYLGGLPCLENLRLTGNPVASSVDYRSRVLSRFGDRLNDIYLDNEKGSQKELDTALALAALRISKSDVVNDVRDGFCTISKR